MRYPVCVLLVVVGFPIGAIGAPTEFPYTGYINAESVYARSGPGEDYYPTTKFSLGQAVEVYRHDPGGWYAIRPPEGSYTWVSSRYLTPAEGGLARVSGTRVLARVGTAFDQKRDVHQVQLEEGELVELLPGQPPLNGAGEKPVWYKIMPPSGEFRWVFGKYVDRDNIYNGVRKRPAPNTSETADEPGAESAERLQRPPRVAPPRDLADAPAEPGTEEPPPRSERADLPPDLATADEPRQNLGEPDRRSRSAAVRPTAPREELPEDYRGISPEEYQAEIDDIELRIAGFLSKEPSAWQFAALRQRSKRLLAQSQTALERGQAQALCNKLARLEDLQQRYQAIQIARHEAGALGLPETQLAQRPQGDTLRVAAAPDGRYDGTGQLVQRPHPKTGAVQYALVDPSGNLRCYVAPAPGVNLHHYVGQQVGVVGIRGGTEAEMPLVTAKHIEPIDATRIR